MAAPSSYTETTLAEYLHAVLGNTASALGWSVVGNSYVEAVNETLLSYGVSSIASATDIRKLRALARVEAWRAVVAATAGEHDYRSGTGQFDRSQLHKQALASLAVAEADALPYSDAHVVRISPVRRAHDPYVALDDTVRVTV